MKRSTQRILTTHTGSLPRPERLVEMMAAKELGQPGDSLAFDPCVRAAVVDAVRKQVDAGIDVVSDGEQGKIGYSTYVRDRLDGFADDGPLTLQPADLAEFPVFAGRMMAGFAVPLKTPPCTRPLAWRGQEAVDRDIANFKEGLRHAQPEETFMTAASPGVIALFLPNAYYRNDEEYLYALAEVMRREYLAVHEAGFLLQLDCPDLAMGRHIQFADKTTEEFRKLVELHVEVLDYSVRDIPEDSMRLHLCWGNYEGPHHKDVALRDIIDIVLKARPAAISFEASNPRHEHEWRVFEEIKLPEGKVLIPGVIDSTTNFIEHPQVVADRITRYARLVGKENVIAGTDCGFGTFAGFTQVDPDIAWAKLQSLAEGAELASKLL